MNLEIEKSEQYALVRVTDDQIDHEDSQILQTKLLELLESEDVTNVILDTNAITKADESVLGAIAFAHKRFAERGDILVITGARPSLKQIIETAQIENLELLPTIAEGVDLVFMHEIEKQLRSEGGEEF